MARAEQEQQTSRRRQNRFLLMLLAGAALVSAARDLSPLHDFTSGLVGLTASVHQRVNTAMQSPAEPSCPEALPEKDRSGQPYNWNGRVAPDQLSQMNGNGGIDAVPAVSGDTLLVAIKNSSCNESMPAPMTAPIPMAPRAFEVASAAVHPRESLSRRKTIEAVRSSLADRSATIRVGNDDLRFDFIVRMPARVGFGRRLMNEKITITSFGGSRRSVKVCPIATLRVDAHPEIGRFDFFSSYTAGRMPTDILGNEVNEKLPDPNCSETVAFKTADGIVSLDLLQLLRATLATETLNDETVSDSPRTLKGLIRRPVPATPAVAEDAH